LCSAPLELPDRKSPLPSGMCSTRGYFKVNKKLQIGLLVIGSASPEIFAH